MKKVRINIIFSVLCLEPPKTGSSCGNLLMQNELLWTRDRAGFQNVEKLRHGIFCPARIDQIVYAIQDYVGVL